MNSSPLTVPTSAATTDEATAIEPSFCGLFPAVRGVMWEPGLGSQGGLLGGSRFRPVTWVHIGGNPRRTRGSGASSRTPVTTSLPTAVLAFSPLWDCCFSLSCFTSGLVLENSVRGVVLRGPVGVSSRRRLPLLLSPPPPPLALLPVALLRMPLEDLGGERDGLVEEDVSET